MATKRRHNLVMPAFGLIRGGRLHGWRFHFLRFEVVSIDRHDEWETTVHELHVVARCTPPHWPFHCEITMEQDNHFRQLRAVQGERAKRMPAEPLIANAYRIARLSVPSIYAQK